jgi:cold shock CspA family protein
MFVKRVYYFFMENNLKRNHIIYYQEMSTEAVSSSSQERFTGRVKWFNNKAGYGFITVTDGPKSGSDVFVHHSSVKVDSEQYKYLVQGEYVEFSLSDTKTSDHEYQAGEVSGIKGGKLMCETRRDLRNTRSQYRSTENGDEQPGQQQVNLPRSVRAPRTQKNEEQGSQKVFRARGQGPREEAPREEGQWTYVASAKKGGENSQSATSQKRSSGPRGRSSNKTTTVSI